MTKKNKKLKTNSVSTLPIFSQTFTPEVNAEIRRAATTGIYDIRGGGSKEGFLILMIFFFWVLRCLDTH